MTEYRLNQLKPFELAELTRTSATFMAVAERSKSIRLELYYIEGHFIEVCYSLRKLSGQTPQWQIYSVNHYPDTPSNSKYLTIYLDQINLAIEK